MGASTDALEGKVDTDIWIQIGGKGRVGIRNGNEGRRRRRA
jgi:hypothetical protein